MSQSLFEQKRSQYHANITHPTIQQELDTLSEVFKELIFYFGVLDYSTEKMIEHFITEGIPMLFRPMGLVEGKEKKRYHRLVLKTLKKIKSTLAFQLLEKEERHLRLLQPIIDTLLYEKREG